MAEGIVDHEFAAAVAGPANDLQAVSAHEVEAAAQEVVNAAVRARSKEIVEEEAAVDPATGEEMVRYFDVATGQVYLSMSDGRWIDAATDEVVGDPRNVDPSQYQWVLDMFEYFHVRWPLFPLTMAQECAQAKQAIQSSRVTPILTTKDIVDGNWGGDARDYFKQFFLDPFVLNAIANQQQVLDELAVAMYAYHALLKQAAVDAKQAADETVKVLDGLYDSRPPDGPIMLQLGMAVAGVVVAVASGGTALGISAGLILAGLDGAAAVVMGIEQQKQRTVAGGTVDEVLETLRKHLDEQRWDMDTIEQRLADKVNELADQVEQLLGSGNPYDQGTILPSEPDEDDVTDVTGGSIPTPDEFRPRR